MSIPNDDPTEVSIDAGEFTVGIDGPATQDYTRDDNDAVLAKVEFSTGGEKIDLKDFFIAIEAESQTGAYLGTNGRSSGTAFATGDAMKVTEMLEDVELRNTVTGRTIDGVVLNTLSTDSGQGTTTNKGNYQIYRFDDFIVHGDEVWELRVDLIDNDVGNHPANGDQFKIHICGEPKQILVSSALTTNSTGCNFSNLLASASTAYQMDIEGLSTGDTVGDVRPRGVISGNFHRIANANMTVAVKSLNTRDTTVKNAKDVNLLRFEVRAGEAEDILFTKSVFEAASGSLQNMKNYALWVDTDGDGDVDTILEDGVASQNNTVSFTDLAGGGFVVPAEDTILFEVHGDVASSLVNNGFQMRFATGSSVTFIEAEELDDGSNLSGLRVDGVLHGSATSADITVSTVPSTIWLLVNQGDLYVTQDSTPTRSRQLLGGALGEAVLRLQFHAENEDIDVTDLQLTNSGSTASSVDRLELYLDGATQPFALATVGGCGSDDVNTTGRTFCANMESRQLVIAEGTDVDVIVKPRMKSDTSGGTAGQFIRLFVDHTDIANESTGSGAVRARGDQSSNNLSANDADGIAEGEIFIGRNTVTGSACTGGVSGENCLILGGKNVSVLSKITSIVNANPAPNNTGVPTGVTPFGQFKFTAAAHNNSNNGVNKVTLSGVVFNVTATNINMDATQFFFYNKADSTIRTQCADVRKSDGTSLIGTNASGSLLVGCEFLLQSSVNTQVDNGQESTFVLEGNVLNSQVQASAASTLQAALQNFDSISNGTFGYSSTSSHIDWLDRDSTDTQFFWIEYPETVVNSTTYKN